MTEKTPSRPIIQAEQLTKIYDLLPVLKKLDLDIHRGEFVALLGHNGSGKSTLLRMMAGLSRPTAGALRIGGWEMPQEAAVIRAQVGMVSHRPLLYDSLTAAENLRFFGRLYDISAADLEARIDVLLERVGLLKRKHDQSRTFSRGMIQRLTIARALLHDPDILLLDEPYTGLDQDAGVILDDLLKSSEAEGRTIVMSTHQLDRAARLASRAVILAKGVVGYDQSMAGVDGRQLAADYTSVTGAISPRGAVPEGVR